MGFDPDIPADAPDELDGWEDLDEQQNYSNELESLIELLAGRFPSIANELSQIQSDLDNKVESVSSGDGIAVDGPNSSSPTISLDGDSTDLQLESGSSYSDSDYYDFVSGSWTTPSDCVFCVVIASIEDGKFEYDGHVFFHPGNGVETRTHILPPETDYEVWANESYNILERPLR